MTIKSHALTTWSSISHTVLHLTSGIHHLGVHHFCIPLHRRELKIAKEAGITLDDMRFLTMAVLKQVDVLPREEERIKLSTTSTWIQSRILALPDGTDPRLALLATISINPAELQLWSTVAPSPPDSLFPKPANSKTATNSGRRCGA